MREYDAQGQDDVGPSRYLWSSGETVSQVGADIWMGADRGADMGVDCG